VLNQKLLGIVAGTTTAAGIFWLRRRRNQSRSLIMRLRGMRAGAILMIVGVATRSKGIRGLSRKVGRALVLKSLAPSRSR
jgi:multisubunit Na+/H+ antiporter MnhC subunit